MKEVKSVIVLLRKSKGDGSSYTSDRWRVGAKSEKEAVKIVNEYLKEKFVLIILIIVSTQHIKQL